MQQVRPASTQLDPDGNVSITPPSSLQLQLINVGSTIMVIHNAQIATGAQTVRTPGNILLQLPQQQGNLQMQQLRQHNLQHQPLLQLQQHQQISQQTQQMQQQHNLQRWQQLQLKQQPPQINPRQTQEFQQQYLQHLQQRQQQQNTLYRVPQNLQQVQTQQGLQLRQQQQHHQQQRHKQPVLVESQNADSQQCCTFLKQLISSIDKRDITAAQHVLQAVQALINGQLEPEDFLKSIFERQGSQQCFLDLVPLFKKCLPGIRLNIIQQKIQLEGIVPPPLDALSKNSVQTILEMAGCPSRPRTVHQPEMRHQLQLRSGPNQQIQHQLLQRRQNQQDSTHGVRLTGVRKALGSPSVVQLLISSPGSKPTSPRSVVQVPVANPASPSSVQALASLPGAKPTSASKEKRKFDALREDDDINDVAAMGGVNVMEETKNILSASSSLLNSQMRSCGDTSFLPRSMLHAILNKKAKEHGLTGCTQEVMDIISGATQLLLKHLLTKLSLYVHHRLKKYEMDSQYETTIDTRQELKFLEELDKREQKRCEDAEREILMRAAKIHPRNLEQLQLKEKAKQIVQAEKEESQTKYANMAALRATAKRPRLDVEGTSVSLGKQSTRATGSRPQIKRVHLRDLLFVMEQDRRFSKSKLLYIGLMNLEK